MNPLTRFLRAVVLMACGWLIAASGMAQDINFRDLARPGAPVVKQYTVSGTADDGRTYVLQFEGRDGDRVAAMNSLRSGGYSNTGGSGGNYVCSVTCTGSWWASGSNVSVTVKAGSEDKAKELAAQSANSLCKRQKNSKGVFEDTQLSAGNANCKSQ